MGSYSPALPGGPAQSADRTVDALTTPGASSHFPTASVQSGAQMGAQDFERGRPVVPSSPPYAGNRNRLRPVAGRLLTAREVAERLGVSTATVYALCEHGELVHVRISNAIRVAPADLEAFIASGRRS